MGSVNCKATDGTGMFHQEVNEMIDYYGGNQNDAFGNAQVYHKPLERCNPCKCLKHYSLGLQVNLKTALFEYSEVGFNLRLLHPGLFEREGWAPKLEMYSERKFSAKEVKNAFKDFADITYEALAAATCGGDSGDNCQTFAVQFFKKLTDLPTESGRPTTTSTATSP